MGDPSLIAHFPLLHGTLYGGVALETAARGGLTGRLGMIAWPVVFGELLQKFKPPLQLAAFDQQSAVVEHCGAGGQMRN